MHHGLRARGPAAEPHDDEAPGAIRWGFYLGGWTLIGLLFVAWFIIHPSTQTVSWSQILSEMGRWYLWALLAPAAYWLTLRFRLDRRHLLRRLPIHIACGLVITLVYALLDMVKREVLTAVFKAAAGGPLVLSFSSQWVEMLFWGVEYNLLTYICIVSVIHAYLYYEQSRNRAVKTSKLEAQLHLARLDMLKMQLHPHFLFNTLNAISALMHRDVDSADRMITLLSDLLRQSLDKDDRHQVSLKAELDFLESYLEIEQIRFRDRLRVEIDIEKDCFGIQVPRLILQPLVENAIRHGIAMRSSAGLVAIRARRKGNRLLLSVADDGPGLVGDAPKREGVGLANTRARLVQLYPDEHRIELRRADVGGLEVRLEIPFETEPRPVHGD